MSDNSKSRENKKEQSVWQRRFWEHLIRDENDYKQHIEYMHYNPVKHGLVTAPKDFEYSSFHKYVKNRIYTKCWAAGEILNFDNIGWE